MKDILNEIIEGIEERQRMINIKNKKNEKEGYEYKYKYNSDIYDRRGKSTKAYIIKRIDILREKLLEEKKNLK